MIIGLTGGIATGKSTASRYLADKGFSVIDADVAARAVVEPGEPALSRIESLFGKKVIQPDGTLNRAALGAIVFGDEEKRRQLNAIVHPAVREWMMAKKEKALEQGHQTVILDIPLLFESNLGWMVDRTVLIYTSPAVQLRRLLERNQELTEKEALARMQSQLPIDEKKALADDVIDNSGSLESLYEQLDKWMTRLQLRL